MPEEFEEALNIIFPGEKKQGEDNGSKSKSKGETQIITDEPVMQVEDLVKEGIHMVTIEETSMMGLDEASQMSMNEPLIFNRPSSIVAKTASSPPTVSLEIPMSDDTNVEKEITPEIIPMPPTIPVPDLVPVPPQITAIPIETKTDSIQEIQFNLEDIPEPPPSPTPSEKARRQEELNDLAMLGIDADDMAAQCM